MEFLEQSVIWKECIESSSYEWEIEERLGNLLEENGNLLQFPGAY